MRYALRNQHKIKEALGENILKRITDSLDAHFMELAVVQVEDIKGEKYPIMAVDDTGHTCGLIVFYMTTQVFDVVHLAFKEFIN